MNGSVALAVPPARPVATPDGEAAGLDILNVMQCTHLGGMEQASLRLMHALQARGHRCRVISLNPLGLLASDLAAAGIPAVGLTYRGALGWRSFAALRRRLRNERADALIMTGHNLLAMMALGNLAAGRRLLAMHYHHSERPAWQWKLFYRIARARFDAITFPSDFLRHEALCISPRIARHARTVRNPLAPPPPILEADRSMARRRLGLPAGAPLVGNAGWLVERKRFDVFLKTARIVAGRLPDARFVIAGDGPQRSQLKSEAMRLGIADRVHWLGWVRDMRDVYLALDVLLFNSDLDALGNTPVEAMAHAVPVVASVRAGGLGEILSHPDYGFLTDRHDPALLAGEVMRRLGRGAWPGAVAAARHHALALSDPERIARQVEGLLAPA